MKASIAAAAVAGALAAATVLAQGPAPTGPRALGPPSFSLGRAKPQDAGNAPAAGTNQATPARDPKVYPSSATLPAPTPPDQIKPATIALPNDPIEPYLLTKGVGPFLILARTFRGPQADQFALALAKELREVYGLPAWILRTRDFPMRSNIRNVPPTAERGVPAPALGLPEKVRTYDEAAVLVGDEKTLAAQEKLWKHVKTLRPSCLKEMPSIFHWRQGLCTALRTTNPFVPAQDLFPGRRDELVYKMNQGPHSVFQCPGRYTLMVAQFSGRSTFDVDDTKAKTLGLDVLKRSPLATAADDAEKLAEALAKAPEIRQTGQPVFVYHDRTSSRVMIGAFNAPNDPAAGQLREYLVKNACAIMDTKDRSTGKPLRTRGIDIMLAPATFLTDLDNPDNPIRPYQGQMAAKTR